MSRFFKYINIFNNAEKVVKQRSMLNHVYGNKALGLCAWRHHGGAFSGIAGLKSIDIGTGYIVT